MPASWINYCPHLHGRISQRRLRLLHAPWSRVLLEKITGTQLVKNFSAFYGKRKSITAFKSARHQSLTRARSIQSMPPLHLPSHFSNIHRLRLHVIIYYKSIIYVCVCVCVYIYIYISLLKPQISVNIQIFLTYIA